MKCTAPGDRVVVFGGSGFLGSHVADALSLAGYVVRIFDHVPSPHLRPDQEMMVGDLTNPGMVMAAVEGCRAIFNFAAIADIGQANRDPRHTATVNVMGAINTLEAARLLGIGRYIFASTVYVYSRHGGFYRASKQAVENFIETYHEQHALPFTILRYGTLYGRRAGPTNRIHQMIHQALTAGQIDYPGSGNALREFIHVHDAAALTVETLEQRFVNRHLIVTGQEKLCIRELARMLQEMLPGRISLNFQDGEPEGHYELTPYTFNPKLGHKLVPDDFVDLGQGLLDCILEQFDITDIQETLSIPTTTRHPRTIER